MLGGFFPVFIVADEDLVDGEEFEAVLFCFLDLVVVLCCNCMCLVLVGGRSSRLDVVEGLEFRG